MKQELKILYLEKWKNYFPDTELPIGVFYSNSLCGAEYVKKPLSNDKGYTCIFAQMARLHSGKPLAFDRDNLGCFGSYKTIFGGEYQEEATVNLLVNIEHFIIDKEHVNNMVKINPVARPTGKYLIFKPLDTLDENDDPEIFCIFGNPDVIAGLHQLASFDNTRIDNVIAPFGSGCEQLLSFALKECSEEDPRAVLGGMDTAMRCCIKPNMLTFSVPAVKFKSMVMNMDNSFLNTYIWKAIKPRLSKLEKK
jgi:uncharacterized protein (DUF169 family)